MQADPTAFAILGLKPGARPAAVEIAYRQLIKRYHPDRMGGDSARAAEINWAYQQLRRHFGDQLGPRRGPPVPMPQRPPERRRARGGPWAVLVVAALGLVIIAQRDSIRDAYWGSNSLSPGEKLGLTGRPAGDGVEKLSLADIPLDSDGIERSILDAVRLSADGGEDRLVAQSRTCHRQYRSRPSPSQLDQCVAFDEAAVALIGRDLVGGSGPFGFSAVTARQLSAGSLLSNDTLEVESRLGQIRTRVEMAMAPPDPPSPPPRRVEDSDQSGTMVDDEVAAGFD